MMYNLLWNIRLWFKGILLIVLFPFVMLWKLFVDLPITWAKEFENETA
jgi:hypothetical protein